MNETKETKQSSELTQLEEKTSILKRRIEDASVTVNRIKTELDIEQPETVDKKEDESRPGRIGRLTRNILELIDRTEYINGNAGFIINHIRNDKEGKVTPN